MHVLIIGAAGMIGRKLAAHIAGEGALSGRPVDKLTLADIFPPSTPAGFSREVAREVVDLSETGRALSLIAQRPDVIFHLAAIVSGEAEVDFAKGYRINLDGSRLLFEAIRAENEANGYFPRLVFCSSLAVFGPPFATPSPTIS